jgi:hypothetical protein
MVMRFVMSKDPAESRRRGRPPPAIAKPSFCGQDAYPIFIQDNHALEAMRQNNHGERLQRDKSTISNAKGPQVADPQV